MALGISIRKTNSDCPTIRYKHGCMHIIPCLCPPANACCGMANATPVSAIAATIATIPIVTLWFISQRLSLTILYLRCFTASAKTVGEIVDIYKL